jgi:hypothetical protein
VKRSAEVLLKDEEDHRHQAGQQSMVQQSEVSGITESHTEDGNEDPLGDEDDMEEEVVGNFVTPCTLHLINRLRAVHHD